MLRKKSLSSGCRKLVERQFCDADIILESEGRGLADWKGCCTGTRC